MGKKIKKDDKSPPSDVFEPVQVDAKEAKTGVLLLKSEEEDVVAKAALSLYKFADKSEENKATLLELSAAEELLKLIGHIDPIVKRNSMMALGTMAAHPNVRRYLRQTEGATSTIVNLLSPEESVVVHEFASLCLCAMSQEYTSKAEIIRSGGIEHLVRLLGASDPDVIKNCIECLTLLLQDYSATSLVRESAGLPALLELLKSDYPVIQHFALVAIERVSAEATSRAELRELEAPSVLVNLVGIPELSDLHVFAISALSVLLIDTETATKMLENNALRRLLAFIEDTNAPEDESGGKESGKGKKGGKASDGRSSKKGKKKDKDRADSALPPSATQPVIPTLPHVKEHAARAIARSAQSDADIRRILHEAQVEKLFITLLSNEVSSVQVAGAQGLSAISESVISRQSAGEYGAIEILCKLLANEKNEVREASVTALSRLTLSVPANCSITAKYGNDNLIKLLLDESSTETTLCSACVTMTNLSKDEKSRSDMTSHGAIGALIKRLKSPSCPVQNRVSHCLAALCTDFDAREKFKDEDGFDSLQRLLCSNDDDVRRSASWAISVLAQDDECANIFGGLGTVDTLQAMLESKTRKNAFTEAALDGLLRRHLPAKWALNNRLDFNDTITDGFYDVGKKAKNSRKLCPPLSFYLREPVLAENKPIILVNAVPAKPPTPPPVVEETPEKGSSKGRKKETRSSKGKQKAHKEKEEEQEEPSPEVRSIVSSSDPEVPGDDRLCDYLKHVQERINPLPTTKDQVTALARYVADCMGGATDNVDSIPWELSINTLRQNLQSNIIPIGLLQKGIFHHRALLFKVLADRLGIKTSLHRADYNRAWNEVALVENENGKYPPVLFMVDLILLPGRLMRYDSLEARDYISLPSALKIN